MRAKQRLKLEKQTLRMLIDKELSRAHGGTVNPDTTPTNVQTCDGNSCIVCGTTPTTRGDG